MSAPVIAVENLSKLYKLGEVSTGTISHDLNRWWHQVRGREDPYVKLGQLNDRTRKGDSGYVYALKGVNFTVNQGEVLGIIGCNGAGKSTLLKILSRVTAPTTGAVRIKGRIASLLEVGTGFHHELTGRENIYLNGAIYGMRRHEIRKKLDEIVDFSGCAAYLDTPVKRYSSGMQVRLGFAVAAHLEPEILVVDEVLAVGDSEFQKRCINKMDEVSHELGRTILIVSHQLGVISALCRSGLFLTSGKIEMTGAIKDVLSAYIDKQRTESGTLVWNEASAPMGSCSQLLSIAVLVDGKPASDVPISKGAQIELVYRVTHPNRIINISFHLSDNLGNCILATGNMPSACENTDSLAQGRLDGGSYRSSCHIPANFLNDSSYRVSVFVVMNYNTIDIGLRDCLAFRGVDDGAMRKEYSGEWIGLIRPKMRWETQRLGD